jgi:hypothetical protein
MLKHAYTVGYKYALAESGLVGGEEPEDIEERNDQEASGEEANPADQLAAAFQTIVSPDQNPETDKKLGDPGETYDDGSWGGASQNYGFDNLSGIGLDIRGPESTSV